VTTVSVLFSASGSLRDVTAELASLEAAPGRTAESELVFYGAPVRGSSRSRSRQGKPRCSKPPI
jgi:hypothetical protein